MWFGDLVTMDWWNDLWLNESFATFMSFLAMEKSPRIAQFHETCWVTFLQYKFWGVNTDQLSSTHPICCQIANTAEAESIFDGISYGKGSSWLKQVYYILGYDVMSAGLKIYFDKHQWTNTTLPDFVGALEQAWKESGNTSMGADFNLSHWCDTWLKSSGVNILEPVVELGEGGSLKSLKVRQGCGLRGQNHLRKHKIAIALYEKGFASGEQPIVIDNIVIPESEAETSIDLSKLPSDFVFGAVNVNHDDHAYAKIRYDPASVEWLKDNLQHTHPVTRASVWRNFWILMQDKQITSLQYMEFV